MSLFEYFKISAQDSRFSYRLYLLTLLALSVLFCANIHIPLLGSHPWRQADTLFTGYFFCYEDQDILKPRVAQRGDTSGVAIGEFPLYSWIISIPCQLTGQWDEVSPKVISFFLYLFSTLFFALAVHRKFRVPLWDAAVLFLASEIMISFLTKTLPDGMALFLLSVAAVIWTKDIHQRFLSLENIFAFICSITAFLIRPYLAPLIYIFLPWGFLNLVFMTAALFYFYQKWFVEWTQTSTFQYYYVRRNTLEESLKEAPHTIIPFLRQVAKDHLNYVLVPFLLAGLNKRFRLPLIWLGSFILIVYVSGSHFMAHGYYLFATAIMGLILAALGLPKRSPILRKSTLFLFAVIGIMNTQHYFHKPRDPDWEITGELVEKNSPYKSKIVTLTNQGDYVPIWLYYSKRTGWSHWDTPENRRMACTLDASLVLIKDAEKLSILECDKN